LREKGFATGRIEGMLSQRVEGLERALFVLCVTEPGFVIADNKEIELLLLQTFLPIQILNNKYRKDLRKQYDLTAEFEEELLNNKIYGCLTDGVTWVFL
jgi:hypothetical protein